MLLPISLQKAHLFRASELYSDWNSNYIASDLDAVIQYGSEVVDASVCVVIM